MSNTLSFNHGAPIVGLGNFTQTIVDAGEYTLECKSSIPLGSALEIELKQNSTSLVDVGGDDDNPTPTQQSMGASASALCAAGDVLHVILSSANAADSVPNAVKSMVVLSRNA